MSYEQETTTLAPGDLVVLYTDGVTEAEGPREAAEEDARKGPLSPGADAGGAQPSQEPAGDGAEEELEDDAAPMFGEERLIEVVRASAHRSAAEIKEAILAAVDRFAAGVPQSDDITLVLIKRRGDERSGEEDGDVQQA
jgi:serine phosphatase RsbU (regulator of sigma subunit)